MELSPERLAEVLEWLTNPPGRQCSRCKEVKPATAFPSGQYECTECGRTRRNAYSVSQNKKYYSKHRTERRQYNVEHEEEQKWWRWEHNSLNWAKEHGFEIKERVEPRIVCERAQWMCWCGEPVDPTLDRETDLMAATMDHIAPIHSYATVRLAHRACNASIKGFSHTEVS